MSAFVGGAFAADLRVPPPPVFTQLPAVDGVNGKFEAFGMGTVYPRFRSPVLDSAALPLEPYRPTASNRWRGGGGGAGAISAPLGGNLGIQADGMIASFAGRGVAGVGGHLFWRDPSRGLIGVYGSGSYFGALNGLGVARGAGQAEAYFGPFTIEGMLGVETGHRNRPGSFFAGATNFGVPYVGYSYYNMRTRLFDKVALSYYASENLKLSVGQIYTGGKALATVGAEYLFPVSQGIAGSLFAEGYVGGSHAAGVRGGLKFYFGRADKSLIRRHREDDPAINLPLDLLTISNTRSNAVIVLPVPPVPAVVPPPPPCMGEGCDVPS